MSQASSLFVLFCLKCLLPTAYCLLFLWFPTVSWGGAGGCAGAVSTRRRCLSTRRGGKVKEE